jgi:hypothetical protein
MKISKVLKEWKFNLLRGVPSTQLQSAVIVYKYQLRNHKHLPPMIGWWRRIMGSGGPCGEHLYGYLPIFGHRKIGIVSVRQDMDQVLVMSYGDVTWINVDANDFFIMDEPVVGDTHNYINHEE